VLIFGRMNADLSSLTLGPTLLHLKVERWKFSVER